MSFSGAQSMYAKMMAAKKAKEAEADKDASSSSSAPAATDPKRVPPLQVPSVAPPKAPVVVCFGSTNYAQMGKRVGEESTLCPNLLGPHRLLAGFGAAKITFLATGCTSAHVIALGAQGEVFAWGRNDSGQLGLGDTTNRATPSRLEDKTLQAKSPVVLASTGKAHTLLLTSDGQVLGCGACKQGAVGNGVSKQTTLASKPVALSIAAKIRHLSSGTNFNLAIDEQGDVWSWGWPEHGVLGNGSDGQYNKSDSTIKLAFEPEYEPRRVRALVGKQCVHTACGQHHCAALDGEGYVYTWGNGGYGRLGHRDQKDVWVPKALSDCGMRARQIGCGALTTAAIGWPVLHNGIVCVGAPTLFLCGRVRGATQNSWMYPQAEDELRGWSLHSVECGAGHTLVHADQSLIAWGSGCQSGELGLVHKKSSARPAKVDALEGVQVAQMACGLANSLVLVEACGAVEALPEWTPSEAEPGTEADADAADAADASAAKSKGKGKRPAGNAASAAGAKKGKK